MRPYPRQAFTFLKSTIETLETNSKSKIETLEHLMKSEQYAFRKRFGALLNVCIYFATKEM